MNYYLSTKKLKNREFRVYPENAKIEGQVIYSGHKMGIDDKILPQIINIKIASEKNTYRLFRYDDDKWIDAHSTNLLPKLLESWDSILNTLESKCGKFKKVTITLV
jgi:hypothetical protein